MTQSAYCLVPFPFNDELVTVEVQFEWEPGDPGIRPSLSEPGEPPVPGYCDEITDVTLNDDSIYVELTDDQLTELHKLVDERFDEADFFGE